MAENIRDEKFFTNSKKLGLAIYAFLLDESSKKRHTDKAKLNIDRAADCMKKVFKPRFADQAMLKMTRLLQDIFAIGSNPVPVKNRIAAESHKRQGNAFLEGKMFELAESEYTTAIDLDPRNAIFYCNRAASRIGRRSLVDTVKDCDKALELDKNYVKAYCWLGLAYTLMEHHALANRYYRKAVRIEPNNPVCAANLELISKKLNREVLKVSDPLTQSSRCVVPIPIATNVASNQALLQKKSSGDHVEVKKPENRGDLESEKFELDDKLKASMLVVKKF